MQINKDYEPEINLKDLFFHILYRWRSILIFALICAIALGCYQYFYVKITHDAGKLTKSERQYQLDLQSYKENLEGNKIQIKTLTDKLAGQQKYLEKSIYIQLDAQNVWTAEGKYMIKVDQSVLDALPAGSSIDPADSILPAYSTPFAGDLDEQALKEAFTTDEAEYINELVTIEQNTLDNTFTVQVRGSTKENAAKGLAFINERLMTLSTGAAQEMNPHQLIFLGETISLGADEELAQKQTNLTKQMTDDRKALQQARTDLNALEAKEEPSAPSNHIKMMVAIGFIAGVFLLVMVYAIGYVLNGRLKDGYVLTEKYGVPVFGQFAISGSLHKGKNQEVRGLDKLFTKWELGNGDKDPGTVYDRIASLIDEQSNSERLLLISTLPEEKLLPVKEALSKRLFHRTIEVRGGFLQNGEAVSEAAKAEAVVLVEAKNMSLHKEIDSMAEMLIIGKSNVIGAIIL